MKCNRKKALPTGFDLARINDENILNAQNYLHFASRSMLLAVREKAGFGRERMRQFNDGHSSLGREYVRDWAVDGAPKEYAVDSYWAILRDLMADCGFDPSIFLWGETPFREEELAGASYGYTDDVTIRERRQYLDFANKMSFYVRELLTMGAKELRDTNRFGLSRLSSVFSVCRVDWFGLMLVYLQTMDPAAVQEEMRKMLERFNGMGFFGQEEEKWQRRIKGGLIIHETYP